MRHTAGIDSTWATVPLAARRRHGSVGMGQNHLAHETPPSPPGLEGRCSIQMSYGRVVMRSRRSNYAPYRQFQLRWANRRNANGALGAPQLEKMVGVIGFEPTTSCSQSKRATGLRHTPTELQQPQIIPRGSATHNLGTKKKALESSAFFAQTATGLLWLRIRRCCFCCGFSAR